MLGLLVLLLPVPWRHKADSSLGIAWRLDRRLVVDGERLDPPGRYSWLTVGRPAVVAEVVWERLRRVRDPEAPVVARDLRRGSAAVRPVNVDQLAAAVGMQRAGHDVHPAEVRAAVGGHGPPYSWIRSMAMGSSHGLIVGVATYDAMTDHDLAGDRHVAGTGGLRADGTVTRIGGIVAKATAARRSGADVMLLPASQLDELADFDPGPMRLLPVETIDEAILALELTRR